MASTSLGYDLCDHITEKLNNIITTTGKKIPKDHKTIWDGFLHEINNDDWESMFQAFKEAVRAHEIDLTDSQEQAFMTAWTAFQKYKNHHDRCMDVRSKTYNNKPLAWKMIMTIREIWNKIAGVDIPNIDGPERPKPEEMTPRQVKEYRREINITIQERLFEL